MEVAALVVDGLLPERLGDTLSDPALRTAKELQGRMYQDSISNLDSHPLEVI